VKVESLLQREGRGPVDRTGPIPLPGRRPRHSVGRRVPDTSAAGTPAVDPDADTEPVADRPRWWPLRRRPARGSGPRRAGRLSRATVLIALAALAAALGAAGIAVAAWLSSGSGKPGLAAATALAPTTTAVAGSAVTTGLLTPGTTGTAVVTVTNPNPYRVKVLTIGPNGAATATGGAGTCATTGVTFTVQQPGVVLAAKASSTLTLAGAVAMSTTSETGCQGATFTVPVTVGVASTP
jgi:hypothetical protein